MVTTRRSWTSQTPTRLLHARPRESQRLPGKHPRGYCRMRARLLELGGRVATTKMTRVVSWTPTSRLWMRMVNPMNRARCSVGRRRRRRRRRRLRLHDRLVKEEGWVTTRRSPTRPVCSAGKFSPSVAPVRRRRATEASLGDSGSLLCIFQQKRGTGDLKRLPRNSTSSGAAGGGVADEVWRREGGAVEGRGVCKEGRGEGQAQVVVVDDSCPGRARAATTSAGRLRRGAGGSRRHRKGRALATRALSQKEARPRVDG